MTLCIFLLTVHGNFLVVLRHPHAIEIFLKTNEPVILYSTIIRLYPLVRITRYEKIKHFKDSL